MTAEEYIEKAAETSQVAAAAIRKMSECNVPEFSSEKMTVKDTARLTGLPETAVRKGIEYGWLPIGTVTIGGERVTRVPKGRRPTFHISPRKVWEVTGHVWRGRAALDQAN